MRSQSITSDWGSPEVLLLVYRFSRLDGTQRQSTDAESLYA
jgi:hypothetical protein